MRPNSVSEAVYRKAIWRRLGKRKDLRLWRQNCGSVVVAGSTRRFHAGPPSGAADLSGIAIPDGYRVEIEVKTGTKQSLAQVRWAEFIAKSGGLFILATYDAALSLVENVDRVEADYAACLVARRMTLEE